MEEPHIDEENLDLSKVPAIQQKRTLAFVNHFIISTVDFLNKYSKTCEYKLMQVERKLDRMEAATVLLEARLSSIPEINTAKVEKELEQSNTPLSQEPVETTNQQTVELQEPSISPEYDRFIKMVQVGVPLEAAKLKASVEGLDPNILERAIRK